MKLESDLSSNKGFDALSKTLASLTSQKDVKLFLRDVCTLTELQGMSGRMEVALLLQDGVSYREIAKQTGVSTTTITRVAFWMKSGMGGYNLALSHHRISKSFGKRLRQS